MLNSNEKFVSIIIPCRNEEKFIGKCLDSLVTQDYPKEKLEILVIDGGSKDKTKEVVNTYSKKYDFIKLFDNPKNITPTAMNIGIKNAKGEIVSKTDAHTTYQKDYVSKSIRYLFEYNADCVGGIALAKAKSNSLIAKAITLVLSDKFGGGGAFRTRVEKSTFTDTAFGCFYKKEVFEKIGLFNEKLKRSQDIEFNLRLNKAGGKVLLAPDIISYYYPKATFKAFFKHNISDGIWAIYPLKFGAPVFTVRHLAPLAFILILIGTAVFGIFFKIFFWLLLLELVVYFGTSKIISIKIAKKEKKLILTPYLVNAFFARHFGYGIGSFIGIIKLILPAKSKK